MSFKTSTKDRGAEKIRSLKMTKEKVHVAVGVLTKDAVREDGAVTNAMLATIHEFGTEHIPSRSFLRSTFRENLSSYKILSARLYSEVLFGRNMNAKKALNILGLKFVADIKNKIRAGIAPGWAESTIDAKQRANGGKIVGVTQLVNTGQLRDSIHHQVRTGEGGK